MFFNVYVNDYIFINVYIPSCRYNIDTLYDCFWGWSELRNL